ncbi:metallophosphoesterase family protein [Oxynema aestuarii]|uniref:Metallophosphoesterase n=1 Tax=Oxynema aestuarii AP17 TaxID=2064643 RepID=A0A6H1TUT4_9CYAN|nr:metallophosphoesterase [Oxynema aestuarii]QIZ69710.1 metallophosphoesterase [Oxynema aestuarii AP17]
MSLNIRFGVVSDPHVALEHTVWDAPNRFHLSEISIPALERVFEHFLELELDFLLLPGDLTQHGEPENHRWLADRLARLPFPAYVIPGNHDVPVENADRQSIAWADFPSYYRQQGYDSSDRLYYTRELAPGLRAIALNSNQFNSHGQQVGRLDDEQLHWLQGVLDRLDGELVFVLIHHNVIEHLPNQSKHPMGRRYMLENAPVLLEMLRAAGVQVVFTGHLHVQDLAYSDRIYDITTGSLVSYPHPYRTIELTQDDRGSCSLKIESHRVETLPDWPNLSQVGREWMGDRSRPFMIRLLTEPPLNLPAHEAERLAPHLRYFWADIARGDAVVDFPDFPPAVRRFFQKFSANNAHVPGVESHRSLGAIDNHATLLLDRQPRRLHLRDLRF